MGPPQLLPPRRSAVLCAALCAVLLLGTAAGGARAAEASSSSSTAATTTSSSTSTTSTTSGSSTSSSSFTIPPPAGEPVWQPELWNRAFKLSVTGVPAPQAATFVAALKKSAAALNVALPQNCSSAPAGSFDSTPAATVALGSCFSRSTPGGTATTTDFWAKLPGSALLNANCFCYALGFWRGGFCYPGSRGASLTDLRQRMTCPALHRAMLSDGAVAVPREAALAPPNGGALPPPPPAGQHYVALLARPESCVAGGCYEADFHAMRRDADGTWSWKHPGMPAANRDLFGRPVTDPEAAALPGSYTLCGYFLVAPQQMLHADAGSLRSPGPLGALGPGLEALRALPGVSISILPLPYNAATDAVLGPRAAAELASDAAWAGRRGSEVYEAWRAREQQALELRPRGFVAATEKAAAAASGSSRAGAGQGGRGDGARRLLSLRA